MLTPTRLATGTDLLAAAPDPWTRGLIAPSWTGPAWAADGAAAYGTATGPDPAGWITLVGEPAAAGRLLRAVLADLPEPPYGVTVPRGTDLDGVPGAPDPADDAEAYEHWELMTAARAPEPVRGEERVAAAEGDPAEIGALLAVASPGYAVRPGDPQVELWAAVRAPGGDLAAVGALQRRPATGVAHLASIATGPAWRGQGLGAAVTSWLTRRVLASGDPECTLSVHSTNATARRLYERLGYATVSTFTSVSLDES
ncbi:GNAT family N-acetyltransferase [Streptomyces sp. URMC 123]|uniref:GNAT family N-acetyltransferase n=1 Tax=Streptomyces sp. URMC 123 TaxID=3423403 RepID=UPI003F1C5FC6